MSADGSHASYIAHHNGPQYFGSVFGLQTLASLPDAQKAKALRSNGWG